MANDFGTGIDGIADVGRKLRMASGLRNLGNALARRLQTPRGSLPWDRDCGLDVRSLLLSPLSPVQLAAMQSAISREVEKDDRVLACECALTLDGNGLLRAELTVDTADGPYRLVLGVDQLTVEILEATS